jgi:hypothetical protein
MHKKEKKRTSFFFFFLNKQHAPTTPPLLSIFAFNALSMGLKTGLRDAKHSASFTFLYSYFYLFKI